jgi:hypothetical protein
MIWRQLAKLTKERKSSLKEAVRTEGEWAARSLLEFPRNTEEDFRTLTEPCMGQAGFSSFPRILELLLHLLSASSFSSFS